MVHDSSNICRNVVVLTVQQKQAVHNVYSHFILQTLQPTEKLLRLVMYTCTCIWDCQIEFCGYDNNFYINTVTDTKGSKVSCCR